MPLYHASDPFPYPSLTLEQAVPQNKKGHLIGPIKDIGHDPKNPDTRLYATNLAQPWHNDGPADLVSLLCLKAAKAGGSSSWASSSVKRTPLKLLAMAPCACSA